jgi:predicted RNA-binding protein Jag
MNDQSRRFFSGNTVQQAVVTAASHYGIDPDEVAYRQVDKRHGFLKVRKRVVIEVDPEHPRRVPGQPAPPRQEPHAPPPAPPPRAARPPRREEEAPRRAPEEDAPGRGGTAAPPAPSVPPPRGDRPPRREEGPRRAPRGRDDRPPRAAAPERRPPRERGGDRPREERPAERWDSGGELVALPERPRPLHERLAPATGPLAEAARTALDKVLAVAGLTVDGAILQGEDRLEIELSGRDRALLTAEDGELLLAIEHLLPRAIRGVAGESIAVRVDCENFHELREERLRSLAQRVASEVRRSGQAKKLPPMNPADRRIVHLTVADEPGVASQSEGDGYLKRVRVEPE